MEIRRTTLSDLDTALDLYAKARIFMREHGNPDQWGDNYPSREQILTDIQKGCSYLCWEEEEPLGIFYFAIEADPDYAQIYDGSWLNDKPYGVMHRVASPSGRRGVASFCVHWCLEQSNHNVRIDTHQANIPMQKMLEKNGFQPCGIIYVRHGGKRIAYQSKTEDITK